MSLIAIGDVHGCARTLDVLLDRLAPASDDHLVFIGDYVDRGPDSKGVIDRLIRLAGEVRCTFLRGNHDQMMLDYADRGEFALWRVNGGLSTVASYMKDGRLHFPEAHLDFLRKTPLYLDTPEYFFVHAGLHPDFSVAHNVEHGSAEVYLWERAHFGAASLAWEKPVVCGHTPHPEPVDLPRLICIDTGCVYFRRPELGRLCAVRLPEREFVLVEYEG
jgi:serine/threonine protein phosphatase 1